MKKYLEMNFSLKDEKINKTIANNNVYIDEEDYPYIMLDHEVNEDEVDKAIDTLLTYFAQKKIHTCIINLDERNYNKTPTKEFTIEELENIVGYKIKIVRDDKDGK